MPAAKNTKRITISAILAVIAVISLFFATILPTNRLTFYALSSFFISVIIIEFDMKSSLVFYVITNLLAYIIVPDKISVIPYTVFFGVYGIIKYYIEGINKILPEYILKMLFFNTCLGLAFILFRETIFINWDTANLKIPLGVVVIILELAFILYDYVYTLIIQYYKNRLRRYLKL